LEILLTDYLVNTISGRQIYRGDGHPCRPSLGVCESAARLASNASANDGDDIDWTVMTHPGSVVWSSLFGINIHHEESRKNFLISALAGYRTGASLASFFGKSHRVGWHVTATAGTFAAASTAATALGLTHAQHIRAIYCAGATAGGIGQAAWERSGAARLNRAVAASSGILAAYYAISNIAVVENLWDGPRGLFELFSINSLRDALGNKVDILDGVKTSSLRLFPVNGFVQSAILASTQLSKKLNGGLKSINVEIPVSVLALVDGSRGGAFWDIRLAIASAWRSKDPMSYISEAADIQKLSERVTILGSDLPVGGATVTAETSSGSDHLSILKAPGGDFSSHEEADWRKEKWERLLGHNYESVVHIAQKLINEEATQETWTQLKEILGST
jgi:2-methylcitrate dehydratase PrpD